ncbi:MAG: orotate phosphoribosyltransferase [Oscillatoriales cyanobacterium SM2_2_1]|nr:orotate phosphoribosyltransferase [Oscillatoriales cyanobacterium SM2_2_1]
MLPVSELRSRVLAALCRLAYRRGAFVLSSGQSSDYYINGKQVTLDPFGAWWIGQWMFASLSPETVAVGGLTLGADPLVTAVSVVSAIAERPVLGLIVRKQPKGHGTQAWIEGQSLPAGSVVTVLEDVVTTGASALLAAEQLRAAGYRVSRVIALVDRDQGGAEQLAAAGLELHPLLAIAEVHDYYHRYYGGQHGAAS